MKEGRAFLSLWRRCHFRGNRWPSPDGQPGAPDAFSSDMYSTCDLFPSKKLSEEQVVAKGIANGEWGEGELRVLVTRNLYSPLTYSNAVVG